MTTLSSRQSRTAQRVAMLAGLVGVFMLCVPTVQASLILDQHIVPTSGNEVASGNGGLDLILLGFAGGGGVNENAYDSGGVTFDGDDANIDMPTGGPTSIVGSYITSMGEIRDFYVLNFPDPNDPTKSRENQLALFVDLSETGTVNHITVNDIRIVIDFDDFTSGTGLERNDPAGNDIDSETQGITEDDFTGGTLLSQLDPSISPKQLALNIQGAGWADYGILTGINPFDEAYSDDTKVLFFWDSEDHDDGGDKVFLSGSYSSGDIPEPATILMMTIGGLLICRHKK